jgi:NAD(P)-dependent dehydrogenase (short-subunit alcohol dehydrogenase family)
MTHAPVIAITEAGALGQALTTHLLARGWRIAIYHLPWMREHAAALLEPHARERVCMQPIDPADWSTLARAVDATHAHFGCAPTHALVVFDDLQTDGSVHHGGGADICARVTTLNLDAVYRTLHALLPAMVAARQGSVVVMGSRLAQRPWEGAGAAAFTATKAATLALVQAIAREVLDHGVRVNAVLEGIVDEPGARRSVPHAVHSSWVSMESLVGVITFLLSEEARDISGAGIPLYGRS